MATPLIQSEERLPCVCMNSKRGVVAVISDTLRCLFLARLYILVVIATRARLRHIDDEAGYWLVACSIRRTHLLTDVHIYIIIIIIITSSYSSCMLMIADCAHCSCTVS